MKLYLSLCYWQRDTLRTPTPTLQPRLRPQPQPAGSLTACPVPESHIPTVGSLLTDLILSVRGSLPHPVATLMHSHTVPKSGIIKPQLPEKPGKQIHQLQEPPLILITKERPTPRAFVLLFIFWPAGLTEHILRQPRPSLLPVCGEVQLSH